MLAVETEGVETILHVLEKIENDAIKKADLEDLLENNAFFVDFYASWQGVTRGKIAKLFLNLGKEQDHYLLEALRQGFLKAYARKEELKRTLATIKHMELEPVERKVLRYLPEGTTLETTIHLTIDGFNAGFQHKGEVGTSLLLGRSLFLLDAHLLQEALPHELHHVAVNKFFKENEKLQRVINQETCRSVFFRFIKDLLSEGMANYYFTFSERSFRTPLAVIHGLFSSIASAVKHFFQDPSLSTLYWEARSNMVTYGMLRYKIWNVKVQS